jgi:hypothetical protein
MTRPLILALLVFGATDAAAQRLAKAPDYLAPGPFVVIGGGVGSVGGSCNFCADWSGGGIALRSGLGWRFSSRLAMDVNVDGIEWTEGSTLERDVHVTVGGQWRAWRTVAVRLGVGPAIVRQEVSTGSGTTVLEARSLGLVFGASYEVPMSRRFTLSPYVNFRAFGGTDLELGGSTVAPDYSTRSVDIGAAVTLSLRSFLWPDDRDRGPE